jgi:hypothetical protein
MLPSWDKTKTTSKKGFDKAWGWADKRMSSMVDGPWNATDATQSAHPSIDFRTR